MNEKRDASEQEPPSGESCPDNDNSANTEGQTVKASSGQPEPLRESLNRSDDSGELPSDEAGKNGVVMGIGDAQLPEDEEPSLPDRLKTLIIGRPRDLQDRSIFSHVSLVAFLAWVGLGADGLSSTSYGPAESFNSLGEHRFLAVFLALAIGATVFIISACYSHIIEIFPSGGGGYLVATKLLGRRIGAVAGSALLVDYVLTITVSIAAAGDALFGLLGPEWYQSPWKLYAEFGAIVFLIVLNLRGVKESILLLLPIFLLFLLTHFFLVIGALAWNVSAVPDLAHNIVHEVSTGIRDPEFGWLGILTSLLFAYSLGAGTYTGIEAVSNSMQVLREPRVATGQRTMRYMAFSLAFMAGGLIIAYLLLNIQNSEDKTLNLVLTETFIGKLGFGEHWLGDVFLWTTLISEGALLIVAAQAGFIGGPRLLASMAQDSWMPRWFANLSERLATHNGILLMGLAALGALLYTHGNVHMLVIMYSINVFLTFSLSMIGMSRYWYVQRAKNTLWRRRLALFLVGGVLCVSILCVTVYEKFDMGGWRTLVVTGVCVGICFLTRRYYRRVGASLRLLNQTLAQLPTSGDMNMTEPDPSEPAAVILVGDYSGLGVHTMLNAVRFAPNHFKSFIFISVGVIDTGNFKGAGAVDDLREHCNASLQKYIDLGRRLGMPTTGYLSIDTDAVDGLEQTCREVARKFPMAMFFAGQLVFQKDTWLHRFLHNQTAVSLQRRLQWAGVPMVILPTRVR